MTDYQVDLCVEEVPWRAALNELGRYDFVHTFDFHKISAKNGEGEPVAFVVRDRDRQVQAFWAALRRPIDGTKLHDLSSVYGYGGPVFARSSDTSAAVKAIFDAMTRTGAVSLFSRMHPLFIGDVKNLELRGDRLGEVVVISVGPDDNPPFGYRGSHRREICKGIESGVKIFDSMGEDSIREFKEIYDSTMKSVGASRRYLFDYAYYDSLAGAQDFSLELLLAKMDDVSISAALFVQTGNIVQYYLSGTLDGYRKISPSKILIAEAHRRAVERKARYLVLGGGVGSLKDELFKFKAGFSDLHLPFYVTRKILDVASYNMLCSQRKILPGEANCFPAYRT